MLLVYFCHLFVKELFWAYVAYKESGIFSNCHYDQTTGSKVEVENIKQNLLLNIIN